VSRPHSHRANPVDSSIVRESRAYLGHLAGIAAALGFAASMTLQGSEHGVVMMPMLAAIMAAAYIGGRNAGLATTLVATFAALYVAPPGESLWVSNLHDLARVLTIAILGSAMSVTIEALHRARRRAEAAYEAAHRGEARFSRMFMASPVANSLSRLCDGIVIDVNAAYLNTFGVTHDAIVGTTPRQAGILVDDDAREKMFAALRSADGGTLAVEVEVRIPDGGRRDVFVSSQLIEVDGEELVLTSYLDVTARRRAEAKANAAGMRLRELAEVVDASFWIFDPLRDRLLYISPGYEKIFGRTCESHLANPNQWLESVHADDAARVRAWVSSGVIHDGESCEFRIVRPDGEVRWVSTRAYARRDAAGTMTRIAGVTEDITARKQAEAEAQASQQQFQQLAEAIDEVIWMIDARTGARLYISPAYEKVWGRPAGELWASNGAWMEAIHPDDRDRVGKVCGGVQRIAYEEKYRIVRPDGSVRWIRDKAFPVCDERGEVTRIAGIAQDITDALKVAEKLQQTQKLESIGLLAGGVAHDFNNILCAITASAEMLAEDTADGDPRSEWIGEIQGAAERASGLTRQLLAFSRKQRLNPVVLDLNRTVDDARRMLRRMLGEDTVLRVALDPDVGRVLVDQAQIVQVLMNLCVNARDAMGAGGSIFIETRAETDAAVLSVRDSGPGMSDDVKARAFEPFFTTKPVGKGTGLGLAVVHGIVEQAGGSIELESEVGKGTSFRIRLPLVAAVPERAPEVVWSPVAGTERILLVDDDEPLRTACARALKKLGYDVIQARDGVDALRVLRQRGREIDLLVTDVVMPNMNGPELAEVAAREVPGLRVLYTSGYPGDELGQRGVEQTEVALLEKPFRPHALASKIRELIDPVVPEPRGRGPSSKLATHRA
jgi:PAS domain S-box-containing protein